MKLREIKPHTSHAFIMQWCSKEKTSLSQKKLHASHYNEYERGRFDQQGVLISCYNMISPKQIVTPFDDKSRVMQRWLWSNIRYESNNKVNLCTIRFSKDPVSLEDYPLPYFVDRFKQLATNYRCQLLKILDKIWK